MNNNNNTIENCFWSITFGMLIKYSSKERINGNSIIYLIMQTCLIRDLQTINKRHRSLTLMVNSIKQLI